MKCRGNRLAVAAGEFLSAAAQAVPSKESQRQFGKFQIDVVSEKLVPSLGCELFPVKDGHAIGVNPVIESVIWPVGRGTGVPASERKATFVAQASQHGCLARAASAHQHARPS